MTRLGESSRREPDDAPINIAEYDWYMTQWHENQSQKGRVRPDGTQPSYAFIRPATITVRIDEGDRVREYVLVRRPDSNPPKTL